MTVTVLETAVIQGPPVAAGGPFLFRLRGNGATVCLQVSLGLPAGNQQQLSSFAVTKKPELKRFQEKLASSPLLIFD